MRAMIVIVVLFVTGLRLAGGAGLKHESGSWGGGCVAHRSATKSGKIDYGITYLTLNGRVYCVLVSQGGSGRVSGGPPASGVLRAPGGREVAWMCDTADGQSGRVVIGAKKLDLEKGSVFLVNLRADPASVAQVAVERGQLQGGIIEDRLKALARSNERLAEFLRDCETAK